MKIIPVGNDRILAARLRSIKAEQNNEVINTETQSEKASNERAAGEKTSILPAEGKKKTRRFKKESISEEGEK